ncbi:MAG: sigma-70 family RNA polymerase sigma factor [Myxococcota bacterium]
MSSIALTIFAQRHQEANEDHQVKAVPDPIADDTLAQRAARGDELAFTELVDRFQVPARRLARVLLSSDSLADEAAQEVFLKLWERRQKLVDLRPPLNVKGYVLAATRNHCVSILRRRKILRFVGLDSEPASAPPPLELRVTLAHAMGRLSESHRTVLALRFLEGLDYKEIGAVIGRKPEVARSRVHYALKAIRGHLPEELAP